MVYEYLCEQCNIIYELEKPITEDIPKNVPCPHCSESASRVWDNIAVIVPEYFKATSDLYNGENGGNMEFLKKRFKKMPTGREKIYY